MDGHQHHLGGPVRTREVNADSTEYFTVKSAAARVNRSRRTIERWIDQGMPVREVKNTRGTVVRRYIARSDLLEAYREALLSNPTRRNQSNDGIPVE